MTNIKIPTVDKMKELVEKSKELEKELLSNIWVNPSYILKVRQVIDPSDLFYFKVQFEKLSEFYLAEKNIEKEFEFNHYKTDFLETPSYRNIEIICKELKNVSNSIHLFDLLEKKIKNVPLENTDDFLSELQKDIFEIGRKKEFSDENIERTISLFKERQVEYKTKFENGGKIIGIQTGYDKLDEVIDGFREEHLWVIGGYTNMGKTSASLNLVSTLVKDNKKVIYFSLEMGKLDILTKLIGIMQKENGLSILKNFPHDKDKLERTFKRISSSGLTIYDDIYDLDKLMYTMMENKADLYVIDFLQNVKVKNTRTEYERTTDAILAFQELAKKLKSPIMVLSQISNEGARSNDEGVMSFKGSGAIAAAANIAIEIMVGEESKKEWKQKMANGEKVNMKWNIRKNRHGRTGYIDMLFQGSTGIFEYDTGLKMIDEHKK